ncbi:MAG: GNAT family N-acetyltransferase, partial [Actinomycetota bacterium]|nr:GNAT family N-acetyltransferase [Actinomycetota bacterium]
ARPWLGAGLRPHEAIVALRAHPGHVARAEPPSGVTLRLATTQDFPGILAADSLCFDEFWGYGPVELSHYAARERLVVADSVSGVIGYTLSTVSRGVGTLGRLAVVPQVRRRGIGAALLSDVAAYAERARASALSLCTQEHNTASRALYKAAGMRELAGRLVFAMDEELAR